MSLRNKEAIEWIVMGGSAGGLHAVNTILSYLYSPLLITILVVLHRHPRSGESYPTVLGHQKLSHAIDVEDKMVPKVGQILTAPADYHVLMERDGSLALSKDKKVQFSRPSIDVTFETMAEVMGSKVLGILLTGANEDGVSGLQTILKHNGQSIAQDPEEAEVPTMPLAAIRAGVAQQIMSLDDIGRSLQFWNKGGRS